MTNRDVVLHMSRDDRVYSLESTVCDHAFGSTRVFFLSVLMDEDDISAESVSMGHESAGDTERDGSVGVVTAGMHDAHVLRSIRHIILFNYPKCIEVGAYRDRRSWTSTTQRSEDTEPTETGANFKACLAVQICDPSGGAVLTEGAFRVLMQLPPHRNDLREQSIDFVQHVVT